MSDDVVGEVVGDVGDDVDDDDVDEEFDYDDDSEDSLHAKSEGGEEGGGEDGEEESDDDGNDLLPSAKRLKREMKAAQNEYERVLARKDETISSLEAEVMQLKHGVYSEMLKIQRKCEDLTSVFAGYAGVKMDSLKSSCYGSTTKIKQIFNVNEEIGQLDSIDSIQAPVRFSASGVFPHAIDTNKKTHNRELQVENRRPITLTFALFSKLDGRKMTEKSLREDGFLPFKIFILYADNQEEVSKYDFTKMELGDMCEPRFEKIRSQNMVNGKVVFSFRFNITSCDSTPRGRSFVVKVTPDVEELADNDDLTVTTPPFTIRSKVTAARVAS